MKAIITRILAGPPALEVAARRLAAAQRHLLDYEEDHEQAWAAVNATNEKIARLRQRIAELSATKDHDGN